MAASRAHSGEQSSSTAGDAASASTQGTRRRAESQDESQEQDTSPQRRTSTSEVSQGNINEPNQFFLLVTPFIELALNHDIISEILG